MATVSPRSSVVGVQQVRPRLRDAEGQLDEGAQHHGEPQPLELTPGTSNSLRRLGVQRPTQSGEQCHADTEQAQLAPARADGSRDASNAEQSHDDGDDVAPRPAPQSRQGERAQELDGDGHTVGQMPQGEVERRVHTAQTQPQDDDVDPVGAAVTT